MRAAILSGLAFVITASSASAADDAASFIALEKQRSAAIAAHDNAFLNNLYSDDFRGVTATGFQVDKATLMEVFKRDDPSTRFSLDQIEPRLYGDTAIVVGRLTARNLEDEITSQSRYMHVYLHREGRWSLVAGQGTLIPPELR